jgi:hypothetical protein
MARIVGNRIVPDEIIEQDTWRTNMNPQNTWGNYGINTLGNARLDEMEQFPLAHAGVAGPEYLEEVDEDVLNMNQNLDDTGIYTRQKGEPWFAENRKNPIKNFINPETNVFGYQRGPNDFNINNFGITGILKALGGTRSPEKQAFYDEIMQGRSVEPWQTGQYKGQDYGLYNSPSGLKVSSDIIGWGEGREKNLDSAFGSQSIEEMEQKKLEWALDRIKRGKSVHSRFRPILEARGMLDRIGDQRPGRTITDVVTDVVRPGEGASTYRGPPTTSFNRAQAVRAGSYDRTAGPMSGSYGPHSRRAEGGRIGYANGEFVDEDINVEGPGFDFNENIEMTSGGGEEDILEQLVAKYIEAGFPPEQAQAMAMQELQQIVAQSGQGEGIASLV